MVIVRTVIMLILSKYYKKSVYNCGNDDGNGIDGRYAYIVSV